MSERLEADLEEFPGSSWGFDFGDEIGMAIFDRRCRYCARFIKRIDSTKLIATVSIGGQVTFEGDTSVCSRCGPVKLVFEGII